MAVLCTQQRCSRAVGHTSPRAFQKPGASSATASFGDGKLRRRAEATGFQVKQQLAPVLRALARAVGEADKFLFALRRRANDDQNALLLLLEPGLQMDAVRPDINVTSGREIALAPAYVLLGPDFLQPDDGRCDRPGASLPGNAASASSKSPVDMPFR